MRNKLTFFELTGALVIALGFCACPFPLSAAPSPGASGYKVIKTIPLGGEGGWDYVYVDSSARRVYISRGTHTVVMDADTYAVVGDIPDTQGVHGIAIASDLGRGFTSNGRSNDVTIFDLKTLKPIGNVKTDANPDAIVYDPVSKRVFTFNGRDRKSTRLNSSHGYISYAVFCLKKKKTTYVSKHELQTKHNGDDTEANRAQDTNNYEYDYRDKSQPAQFCELMWNRLSSSLRHR